MADYQVYGASRADDATDPERWRVLVEYSNGPQKKPHTIVKIGTTTYTDRAEAYAAAEKTAREFSPPDPWSLQSRAVFRDGPDGFLVMLEGATTTFHMSVRLVVPIG
ncbi:hypothetical protein GCM10028801_20830 [Nocardioides maradonensis]